MAASAVLEKTQRLTRFVPVCGFSTPEHPIRLLHAFPGLRTPGAPAPGVVAILPYSLLSSACKPLHLGRVAFRSGHCPRVEFSGFRTAPKWLAKCTPIWQSGAQCKLLRLTCHESFRTWAFLVGASFVGDLHRADRSVDSRVCRPLGWRLDHLSAGRLSGGSAHPFSRHPVQNCSRQGTGNEGPIQRIRLPVAYLKGAGAGKLRTLCLRRDSPVARCRRVLQQFDG